MVPYTEYFVSHYVGVDEKDHAVFLNNLASINIQVYCRPTIFVQILTLCSDLIY